MAKLINPKGEVELLFLGVGQQKKKGAAGLLDATLTAVKNNLNVETLRIVLTKMSSICTDGAAINTGEGSGLWSRFENEISINGSEIPLVQIWCGAHRLDLAWSDINSQPNTESDASELKVLDKTLSILSTLSSYFHNSAIRTNELKEIADDNGVLSMPKLFTIRWTEYTFNLIRAILTSWNAIVLLLNKKNEHKCVKSNGFHKYLANLNFLRLVAFLGDVLRLFKRLQKNAK